MEIADNEVPVYRQVFLKDLEAIAALEAEIFPEPYLYFMLRQLFDMHGNQWLVAELGGELIGYALTMVRDAKALLFTLAVATDMQHCGSGRALLERAVQRCIGAGAVDVELTVDPDNRLALNMFEQAGFICVGFDSSYFGPGCPRRLMRYRSHYL